MWVTSFTQQHVHNAHAARVAVPASLQHAIHAHVGWPILKAGTPRHFIFHEICALLGYAA